MASVWVALVWHFAICLFESPLKKGWSQIKVQHFWHLCTIFQHIVYVLKCVFFSLRQFREELFSYIPISRHFDIFDICAQSSNILCVFQNVYFFPWDNFGKNYVVFSYIPISRLFDIFDIHLLALKCLVYKF